MTSDKQRKRRQRPVKEAVTFRCPGCGCRYFPDHQQQELCIACQLAQDRPGRTQQYVAENNSRVGISVVTSRPAKPSEVGRGYDDSTPPCQNSGAWFFQRPRDSPLATSPKLRFYQLTIRGVHGIYRIPPSSTYRTGFVVQGCQMISGCFCPI